MYNGTAPYPDEVTLKLSDSFEKADFPGIVKDGPPDLELVTTVYNINRGHNEEKVRKSRTLEGYSAFIAKVREYEGAGRGRKEAMKEAVNWCTANNILKHFFETNATEVVNMLMTEWNWDDAFAVQREEGREEGWMEVARNALGEGLPLEVIQKITGLDIETIKSLAAE
jgi:hypothetical protein